MPREAEVGKTNNCAVQHDFRIESWTKTGKTTQPKSSNVIESGTMRNRAKFDHNRAQVWSETRPTLAEKRGPSSLGVGRTWTNHPARSWPRFGPKVAEITGNWLQSRANWGRNRTNWANSAQIFAQTGPMDSANIAQRWGQHRPMHRTNCDRHRTKFGRGSMLR